MGVVYGPGPFAWNVPTKTGFVAQSIAATVRNGPYSRTVTFCL